MKKTVRIIISAVLLLATVIGFVPPVEVSAARTSADTYKHVVVVGIDGMGNYNLNTSTPNIDKIFKNNKKAAWTDYCMASNPNISAQCWTSMLTGVMPDVHGINNDIVENESIKYNNATYPTLFKYIRQARPNAKLACYSSWIGPTNGMVEQGLNVDTYCTNLDDPALATACVNYIKANKPEFFFCVFNDVDAAGHSYNWGSTNYLNTLTRVDGYIGRIYQAVQDAGMLDDTLFIVTTDHGGWYNGHGVRTTSTKYTFFGAVGKTINPNTNLYVRGVDLAAIVAYAMNVSGNSKWEAVVPQYMFKENMNPKFSPHPDTLTAGWSNRVTPASGLKDYIGNYVNMDKLKMALFFDDNVKDFTGNQTTTAKGTVKYETGYFGKGVNLKNGYISVPNLKMGTDSFSVGVWMKQKGDYVDSADPVIFCNKNWSAGYGASDGVVLTEWGNNPAFRVSDNNTNCQLRATYPTEAQSTVDIDTSGANWVPTSYHDCWVHLLLVIDRPNNKVKFYYNFVLSGEFTMDSWVKGLTFDTGMPFTIGQDADGDCGVQLLSTLDDFMFFDGTLSQTEIDNLRKYYTPVTTGSAPTYAKISTNKSVYAIGEQVKFTMDADGYSNTMWVYRPGATADEYYQQASSPKTMTFTTPGEYSALVQTWNGEGGFMSEKVYFTVVDPATTTKPTTAAPTTAKPTTAAPTTAKPTTAAPTTATPTVAPTTAAPTTAAPTTVTTVPVTKPAFAKVETDKQSYLVGETVKFTCTGAGTNHTLTIVFPDQTNDNVNVTAGAHQLLVTKPGTYLAMLTSVNSAGSTQSEMISFTVTEPVKPTTATPTQATVKPTGQQTVKPTKKPTTKPTTVPTFVPKFLVLTMDKLSYEVGDTAVFAVTNIGNTDVSLVIVLPDGVTQRFENFGENYNMTFTAPGTYVAHLEAGSVKSDIVSFTVSEKTEPATQPTQPTEPSAPATQPTTPTTQPTDPGAVQGGFPGWALLLILGLVVIAIFFVLILVIKKKKNEE